MKPGWLRVGLATLALLTLGCVAGLWWLTRGLPASPDLASVRTAHRSADTVLLDRHGETLQRLRTDLQGRRGTWLALADISPALRQAMLLSEDRRFYAHTGIDWRAVAAAGWARLRGHRQRGGASTISMQLAGLLHPELQALGAHRSLGQKIRQAAQARRIEAGWSKNDILEAYLNLLPLRGELVGVDALARSLFGKAAHALNAPEATLAAALARAPNATPARVAARACPLLRQLSDQPAAPCTALRLRAELALSQRQWQARDGIAPHAAQRLLAQHPGPPPAQLRSTLDARLQRLALDSLQQQLRELRAQQVEDGAVLILDNASGQVLAWVGSSGALSAAPEVDAVTALRQPGSALKPFLYAQALAEQRLSAASLLHDAPAQLATASGLYIPQNYDLRYKGWVSARTALASSLNIPAVRLSTLLTPEGFYRQLQRLGFELPQGSGHYGHSLALGSAEVSLLQLTNAFRTLANGGRHCPVQLAWPEGEQTPAACHQALDAGAAFIVGHILSDANARAPTFGTDSVLRTRPWTAVKTGTSKDMRDNWAIGWSSRYTVGVWVGNASGAPMWDVSGSSGAAPVWAHLMHTLHQDSPSLAPTPPAHLVQQAVRFDPPLEAPRQEWFLPGTEQGLIALAQPAEPITTAQHRATSDNAHSPDTHANIRPRISAPTHGTIIALDPDIPPTNQLVALRADTPPGQPAPRWWLNEQPIGQGQQLDWPPWPGRHRLQLRNAAGQTLDEIRLEVRGAQAAHPNPPSQIPAQHLLPPGQTSLPFGG